MTITQRIAAYFVAPTRERAGGDARDAVPGWSRGRVDVRVQDRRVRVRVRPRSFLPALAGLLDATGEADAGPPS